MIAVSCNRNVSYDEAMAANRKSFDSEGELSDANFIVEIYSLNMLALRMSALAADTGYSSAVVSFAKKINAEHEQLQQDIKDIARKKKINLPDVLSSTHNEHAIHLSSSNRQYFDSEFVKLIRMVNDEYLSKFTNKATQASHPDVRAFAARKLDVLRSHAQSITAIEKQLLNTTH